ncbi:cation channel sperm-associated auxiliary subunit epsilon-like isoform X2 [Calonectris borealis]|uniref:cation channel sperm-associated auxiliary subunit epsilon-like isoform X2 n=1 Tax=Calonectris borealis TaxID=1323832 RepID=UPI003F4CA664
MVLYLNPSANVYMLLIDGSRIYCQTCPLEIEIFSSTFSSEDSCLVVAFQHSMDLNVYYLDMGDEMTLLSLVAFEENVAVSTSLEVYRPHLLQLEKSSSYEVAHGICVKNEVSYFYVGCPPGRHIVVERPVEVLCEKHNFTT